MGEEPTTGPAKETETGPGEDQKAKFREALARKQRKQERAEAHGHRGPDHTHGEHAAEGSRRQFRRKSG